jgi:YgiT-type zinc finger domain-containing protein
MKPDRCSFCKGKLHEGKTEFVAKVRDEVISIKDVPAYVCENCGEAYFTPEISRKIDEVMRDFHRGKLLAHPIAAGEVELKV